MTIAFWAALGGLLGALVRCRFVRGIALQFWPPQLSPEAGRHLTIGFFSGGLLGLAMPFVPAAWIDEKILAVVGVRGAGAVVAVFQEPFGAAFLSALLAYCGLDLTRYVRGQLPDAVKNGNGTHPGAPTGAKLGALLLVVGLLGATACETFRFGGPPMVSAPRTDVENMRVRLARLLGQVEQWANGKCAAGELTKAECKRAREVVQQLTDANAAYERNLAAQGSELNLEPIVRTLETLLPLLIGVL